MNADGQSATPCHKARLLTLTVGLSTSAGDLWQHKAMLVSLSVKCPCRLIGLNTESWLVAWLQRIVEASGGGALLEKASHWGWGLRPSSQGPLPVRFLLLDWLAA